MENKRFKPKFDKLFWLTWIPTFVLVAIGTVLSLREISALIILASSNLFVLYFFFSSLSGYVELRDDAVFIKCGFILKKEIPYQKIRSLEKTKKIYANSMVSIKNSLEHVDIKYNTYDIISVSVCENDELISEIQRRKEIKVNYYLQL